MKINEGNQLSKVPSYSGFLSWPEVGWSWGSLGVEWNSLYPHPSPWSALARAAFIRDLSGVGHLSCCLPSPQGLWQISKRSFCLEEMTFLVGESSGPGVSFIACTKSVWGWFGNNP